MADNDTFVQMKTDDKSSQAALDSEMAQTIALQNHRREINGGWSPRPDVLNIGKPLSD